MDDARLPTVSTPPAARSGRRNVPSCRQTVHCGVQLACLVELFLHVKGLLFSTPYIPLPVA